MSKGKGSAVRPSPRLAQEPGVPWGERTLHCHPEPPPEGTAQHSPGALPPSLAPVFTLQPSQKTLYVWPSRRG